jgi:hypothetical protein
MDNDHYGHLKICCMQTLTWGKTDYAKGSL